jgi:hypothetical protein
MICDKYRGKNTGPQCVNLEMHAALDTWGMADICGTAVDLYVEHALGVNDTVANKCCV